MNNNLGYLRILNGERTGEKFIVRDGLIIGREKDCDVYIPDKSVTRKHCKILVKASGIEIVDLNSSNGTRVNNSLITTAILKTGDIIEIGETKLIYEGASVKQRKSSKRLIIYFVLLVIIIVTAFIVLQSDKDKKSQKLKEISARAIESYKQGNLDEALELFYVALRLAPDNEVIKNNIEKVENEKSLKLKISRAQRFFDQGQLDNAEQELKDILEKNPDNQDAVSLSEQITKKREISARLDSVELFKNKGNYDEAIKILNVLYYQSYDPLVKQDLITTLLAKGSNLEKKKNKKDAINVYDEILNLDPMNTEAKTAKERCQTPVISEKPIPPHPKPELEPQPAPPKPKPMISLTIEQKKQADSIYDEAYRALKDERDYAKAKQLFLKVLEVAPDPNYEVYQNAKEKLKLDEFK